MPGGCLAQVSGPSSHQLRKVTLMPVFLHPAAQMERGEERAATMFSSFFIFLFFRNFSKKVWLLC